jgi:membrane protease YdiL (CAAX protease family)
VLASLIVCVAVMGTILSRAAGADAVGVAAPADVASALAQIAVVQAGLLVYVARVARGRWVLADTTASSWRGRRALAVDAVLAVLAALVILGLETGWTYAFAARPSAASRTFLPHTVAELGAWIAVAVLVAVAEEVVYRGYLQRHLGAILGSPRAGVVASAVLFGVAHLEQGGPFAARAALYGLVFGVLVAWRGSLVPSILAHLGVDVLAGVAAAR